MVLNDYKLDSLQRWIESIFLYFTLTLFVIRVSCDFLANKLLGDRRCLYWKNVLITNASSTVSQELKTQLKEKYSCNVVMIDKHFEVPARSIYRIDFRSNVEAQQKLNSIFTTHGPFDIVIYNEVGRDEDFCMQENENIRDFLTIFVNIIPKMHASGGGQIISLKSSHNSLHSFVQCRKDYGLLAKEIIKGLPNNLSFFALSVVKCPQKVTDVRKLVDRIISVIEKRKKVAQVNDRISFREKVNSVISQCWNNVRYRLENCMKVF